MKTAVLDNRRNLNNRNRFNILGAFPARQPIPACLTGNRALRGYALTRSGPGETAPKGLSRRDWQSWDCHPSNPIAHTLTLTWTRRLGPAYAGRIVRGTTSGGASFLRGSF
jgi:hypothetical protein